MHRSSIFVDKFERRLYIVSGVSQTALFGRGGMLTYSNSINPPFGGLFADTSPLHMPGEWRDSFGNDINMRFSL